MPFSLSPDERSDTVPSSDRGRSGTRAIVRLPLLLLVLVFGALVTAGCLPAVLDPPTSGLNYGKGPLDAIRDTADRTTSSGPYSNCGLSSVELAAMMMVPTYFEAGGTVPAPMALSRWDNVNVWSLNANLFAFGQTSGAYVNAFFSPGIGLWQFDSAGGWDLTASDAIDSVTAANTAASVMAYRWCNTPSSKLATPQLHRQYAWGPWFECSSGSSTMCEDKFNQIVTAGSLNTAQDATVDRYGGMQQRTCSVAGIGDGLTCWYVNPANAQGSKGWTYGTYDPNRTDYVTPLPKPFYVVRANGREYRFWLREDTGYDIGITASHPVTTNARTSIVWDRQALLCDTTTNRGVCAHDPVGSFDIASAAGPTQVRVAGWVIDPDDASSLDIRVTAGSVTTTVSANLWRPDVGAAYPGKGNAHGFDAVVPSTSGLQQVCVTAVNSGAGANVQLGCKTVNVLGPPLGSIDGVAVSPGRIAISGWAAVQGDTSITSTFSIDGGTPIVVQRTVPRPDVAAVFPWAGPTSGFATSIPTMGGTHTICLSVVGAAPNAIACRQVTLPTGSPFGSLDAAWSGPGSISVSGWVIDPDLADPTDVHIWIGPLGVAVRAGNWRGDVGAAFPAYGPLHGFTATVPVSGGPQQVCVYGFNQGGGGNVLLGCRQLVVPGGSPFGSLDAVWRVAGGVAVSGWSIDPDTAASNPVHVYVGPVGTAITANLWRPDVGAAFPGYGNSHGFGAVLAAPASPVQVCVYTIESAGTGSNQLLGCRTV